MTSTSVEGVDDAAKIESAYETGLADAAGANGQPLHGESDEESDDEDAYYIESIFLADDADDEIDETYETQDEIQHDEEALDEEDYDPQLELLELMKARRFKKANRRIVELGARQLHPLAVDSHGRTAAHYAAGHEKGEATLQTLVKTAGSQCLLAPDRDKATPMHYSMAVHSKAELMEQSCFDFTNLKARSDDGNSCLHWAAANVKHGQKILTTVAKSMPSCLAWQNDQKQSVLHKAVENLSSEAVTELYNIATKDCIALTDDEGNTWAHFAAWNEDDGVVLFALEHEGPQCLSWTNDKKVSVLHDAVMRCSIIAVKLLLESASKDCMGLSDDDENTIGHFAARNEDVEVLVHVVERIGLECLGWQNNAKQSVLFTAMKHYRSLEKLLKPGVNQSLITAVDENGDTLLHALFRSCELTYEESDEDFEKIVTDFLKAFEKLKVNIRGVDNFRAENSLNQNCLHATTMGDSLLNLLFHRSSSSDKGLPKALLVNSKGRHAVHAFASKYNLDDLEEALAEFSGVPVHDLLRLRASKDPLKGATCLHFACETGDSYNIKYLVKQGLSLSAKTDSGLTCIDLAHDKGMLNEVMDALDDEDDDELCFKVSMTDAFRLIDPAKRALKLPDRLTARQLISSISDESLVAEMHKSKMSHKSGEKQKDSQKLKAKKVDISDSDENRPALRILQKAVELDSSQIFRSAVSFHLITTDTENAFPAFLKRAIGSGEFKSRGKANSLMENAFREASFDYDSELAVIDAVAYFERVEVLSDLVLTRQFDLIPASISLLVRFDPKVNKAMGKRGQLKRLYTKVTSIAVNALDELYLSADEDQAEMLFEYITGEMRDDNDQNPGPKFPCRIGVGSAVVSKDVQYCTVLDLVEHSGNNDLFATDCLHSLTQADWETMKLSGTNRLTPKVKFYIHLTAFVIFLLFFAWYIIDFRRAFQFWPPDVVLFAYAASLTMQEVADFWRRRKLTHIALGWLTCPCRCPVYFKDVLNLFDVSALLLMWIGLLWKLAMWRCLPSFQSDPTFSLICSATNASSRLLTNIAATNEPQVSATALYACQMVLSTSFLLWGFRSVSFLSYSKRIGPVISMLKSLLIQDLVPFFAIILVIFYSFGVFFFNLLFPVINSTTAERSSTGYGWNVFLQVFTLPFNLLFTNFDKIGFETVSGSADQAVGLVAHPGGFGWFNSILLFVFLILANIVMLNLLIARFSLTVSRMDSRALGIWRKTNFEMMREYQNISPVPLPLSVFYYPIALCACCNKMRQGRKTVDAEAEEWWLDEKKYPQEYRKFLEFQATQFRRVRPQLLQEVTRNKSDTVAIMAHAENLVSAANRDTQESLQKLEAKLQSIQDVLEKRAAS